MISLLMTTYRGERADRLTRSLESMFSQTVPPDELVLVLDGPVGDEQEAVIDRYWHDERIGNKKVIRLPQNLGLGEALAAGQDHCAGDWIMRMDSDDISVSDRTEVQLAYVQEHPDVDLIGGWAEEFYEDAPGTRLKTAPTDSAELLKALRWRNVICHPSVLMRAGTVRRVGGYRGRFPYMEDWDLFVRLVLAGAKLIVLPQPLVRVRTSIDQAERRGGWRYAMSDLRFRVFCLRNGFLRFDQFMAITPAFFGFRLVGATVRSQLYRFVRKS